MNDLLERLVEITAHELFHLVQNREQLDRSRKEAHAVHAGNQAMLKFRENREALLAEWNEPVKERTVIKIPAAEKREKKAYADLERWQRKLKLAQTKVRKAKVRVAYYERKQAALKSSEQPKGA